MIRCKGKTRRDGGHLGNMHMVRAYGEVEACTGRSSSSK